MSKIIPYIAQAIFSTAALNFKRKRVETKRVKADLPHMVTVYLRISDPYSALLIQVLEKLQDRYEIEYDFRTILDLQEDMYPAPELWQQNAFRDALYLANVYGLEFPESIADPPGFSHDDNIKITAQLLHWELQPGYLDNAQKIFSAYWSDDKSEVEKLLNTSVIANSECYRHHLNANQDMLKNNGHYLSAMMYYGNEWYWGLDRLQYLERRFNDLDVNKKTAEVKYSQTHINFCKHLSAEQVKQAMPKCNETPIVMYWSLRSPYSYLAIIRARRLADYYRTPLIIKPVLPMVMRRMLVPKNKTNYIAKDVKRESLQYGIEFGRIADPLGAGVERCYAVYEYALSQGKGNVFLQTWAESVWSKGINSATDDGVKKIVERAGLDWSQIKPLLKSDSWRIWAQANLAELYGNGLWGVPSLLYGDCKVFGQDRLDVIERAIVSDLES